MSTKIELGSQVKILDGGYGHETGDVGVVTHIFGNDHFLVIVKGKVSSSSHSPAVAYSGGSLKFVKKEKNVEGGKKKLDTKELDALVIGAEVREEIEAVLKQHKNADTIFTEWGLGDVIEYGRGMIFMFYGPPGTGKTWGAHCIGKAVGQELLIVSAAEIQSSEPGAANRNIQQAFKTAKDKGQILFLDECDSLITSRNDVGIVIGGEINTLLTEIEKCEGIVILATNRIETMDEALERRVSLIIEFPEPNHPQRHEIWKRMLPKKMPLGKDVVIERLADHKLTGGQIKNAVLQAARLALATEAKKVSLEHFESAIARIQKSKSLMGTASRYRQGMIKEHFESGVTIGKKRDIVKSEPEIDTDITKTI